MLIPREPDDRRGAAMWGREVEMVVHGMCM